MLLQIKKVAANKKKLLRIKNVAANKKKMLLQIKKCCERFELRSHFKTRLSLIVRVNVVLNRTVVVDSD